MQSLLRSEKKRPPIYSCMAPPEPDGQSSSTARFADIAAAFRERVGAASPDQCLADGAPARQGGRNHHRGVLRGTGITAYLENGGALEQARQMTAHASTRTTQLYDRREDLVTLDEVVKVNIRG